MIKTVKIEINEKIFELTVEECRQLKTELSTLLGEKDVFFVPSVPIPTTVPFPSLMPYWHQPYITTCTGEPPKTTDVTFIAGQGFMKNDRI